MTPTQRPQECVAADVIHFGSVFPTDSSPLCGDGKDGDLVTPMGTGDDRCNCVACWRARSAQFESRALAAEQECARLRVLAEDLDAAVSAAVRNTKAAEQERDEYRDIVHAAEALLADAVGGGHGVEPTETESGVEIGIRALVVRAEDAEQECARRRGEVAKSMIAIGGCLRLRTSDGRLSIVDNEHATTLMEIYLQSRTTPVPEAT